MRFRPRTPSTPRPDVAPPRLTPNLPSSTGKLLLVIIAAGLIATALLVTRQQRVEAAHELTTLHRRMTGHDRALWQLRATIAERCRPEAVRDMIEDVEDDWTAIPRSAGSPDESPFHPPAPAPSARTARYDTEDREAVPGG